MFVVTIIVGEKAALFLTRVGSGSVGIDLKELGGGSAAEMFEILHRD